MSEVDTLEMASENLHLMARDAAGFLAEESLKAGSPFNLGIPREAVEYAKASLERDDPSFYSRFDLIYSGNDGRPPRMLEYNADTPTGLLEAALIQWYWHEDVHLKAGIRASTSGTACTRSSSPSGSASTTTWASATASAPTCTTSPTPTPMTPARTS